MKKNGKYIGANHSANGMRFGGIDSSFNGIFTNEEVLIGTGLSEITPCQIGNINECYTILKEKINEKQPKDFETICECVFDTVQEYFGDYSNIKSRMSFYKDIDIIEKEEDIGKVSNLKGKNAAMCVERAMLSQNLLKSLEINSTYKCSGIKNNGLDEVHAYNIVNNNDKYYIFDATIPTMTNNKINPLIIEIPKEVYEQITSPNISTGYSVEVNHYAPLTDTDKNIVYDAGREKLYQKKEDNTVKKQ